MNEKGNKMDDRIRELALQYGGKTGNSVLMNAELFEEFAELIVQRCGYYADVFESLGCPMDMDPTETKPSDYIKKMLER
jgi:hypothetical protein